MPQLTRHAEAAQHQSAHQLTKILQKHCCPNSVFKVLEQQSQYKKVES